MRAKLSKGSKNKTRIVSIKGDYLARPYRFGIVVAQFNEYLTRPLLDASIDTLLRHGAQEKNIHVVTVPGAFEIPLATKKLIAHKKPNAVITLSVVIKGKTKHFDQVVRETAQGIRELILRTDTPILLGMVSADTVKDALLRVGIKHMNKGREWALSAIEMASLSGKMNTDLSPNNGHTG